MPSDPSTARAPFFEPLESEAVDPRKALRRQRLRRWSVVASIAAAVTAATLLLSGLYKLSREQAEASAWVAHTLEVLERTASVEADLAAAVSEGRGQLLVPSAAMQARFDANVVVLSADLAALRSLTADSNVQQRTLDQVEPLIHERISVLTDILRQAAMSGRDSVITVPRVRAALNLADRIHQGLESLKQEERRLLGERGAAAQGITRRTLAALVACGMIAVLSLGLVITLTLRRRDDMARAAREGAHLAELRREQDRFRAAVQAVHGVLWTNDANGWMRGEQPGWAALTGQRYDEYQGLGWSHAVHPDDAAPTVEAWTAAVADSRLFVFEHRVRCADGAYRTFMLRAAPVRDEDGSVREWVGVHSDVTAQRTAELVTQRLAAIVTSAKDAIISFAPDDGRILSWNAGAERLFGYTEAEAVGRPLELMMTEQQRRAGELSVFAAAKGGKSVVAHETVRVTKSGERIPVAITATQMLAPDGRFLGVSGTFHDLRPRLRVETALREANAELERRVEERTTELVASEAKLRASEAEYRLLAEHGSDMVARIDLSGVWHYVSPAAIHVLGRPAAALVGHRPAENVHPGDQAKLAGFLDMLLSGEIETGTLVVRALRPDAREVWIEIGARTLHDPANDKPAGCVAFVRDVTDRRRLEIEREARAEEVRAANEELEHSNRALDRLARHLSAARDQANAANMAKSRFLASMSHELRTPLNGILGYAHLIRADGELNPTQASRIEAMLGAGQHLLELISGVLSLSEVEENRVELQAVTVDLRAIAASCLDVVRPTAVRKGLALTLSMDPAAPASAVVDPTRLRQVLLNLLGNAVKFTDTGEVTLAIAAAAQGRARIEVGDTGPGIDPEKRPRLFRSFERLGADLNAVEGAGLGLALSARLAAMMGGSMGHRDNDGGGSVFWVELPVAAHEDAPKDAVAVPLPNEPLRILIVDDVAMNRDVASSFLQAGPYRVTCVESGAEAIAAVARETFDVVLMDVRMPGMDGLEATRRIRALPAPNGLVPVIALTAQAFAEQISECRRAGMDGHLSKPFAPNELLAAITQAAQLGRDRAGPTETADDAAASGTAPPGGDRPILNEATFEQTASYVAQDDLASYLRSLNDRGAVIAARLEERSETLDAELRDSVHALAGSAGMLGFERMAVLAQRLEFALQTQAPDLSDLSDALRAAINATASALATRIAAASTPHDALVN